jgi:formylglycine-generating enzyme required for sulfatase activity
MRAWVWVYAGSCVVGLWACGYPPLPLRGDDAGSTSGVDDALPASGVDAAVPAGDAAPPGSDAALLALPSCVGLAATCGPRRDDSCCNSPLVKGGHFFRSFDKANNQSGDTKNPATVSDFRLDKYEVTVGRFRAFVTAGMGTQDGAPTAGDGAHTALSNSGWNPDWTASLEVNTAALMTKLGCSDDRTWDPLDSKDADDARPINCLTWYEAMAFCAWDGGYLPTEAEWNYAAAGGDDQRAYPWSDTTMSLGVDRDHASYAEADMVCTGGDDGDPHCTVADLVVVGSKPAGDGRWGQSDLAGNVFEHTLDWYGAYPSNCTDCAQLTMGSGGETRVIRGGAFVDPPSVLRTGNRINNSPTMRNYIVGARCARRP